MDREKPFFYTLLTRDLQTQELVVIKQLFLGSDCEWQNLKLFEREAETLKALSHPAIISQWLGLKIQRTLTNAKKNIAVFRKMRYGKFSYKHQGLDTLRAIILPPETSVSL